MPPSFPRHRQEFGHLYGRTARDFESTSLKKTVSRVVHVVGKSLAFWDYIQLTLPDKHETQFVSVSAYTAL
jgi:hypothetical protein